jgi:4-alpha-glucanotransferase
MPKVPTLDDRSSGVLCHITSLPGPHGSGDLGEGARRFIDFLASAGQSFWQVLPVVPPAGGASPYQSSSAFAGDPLLISLSWLRDHGLLTDDDLVPEVPLDDVKIHFEARNAFRMARLHRAFEHMKADAERAPAFFEFCEAQRAWLDDYALYSALKEAHGNATWSSWSPDLARRDPGALHAASERLRTEIRFHQFMQWVFARQWSELRAYASERGVGLLGDIPIFVGHDSADVWARPHEYFLDNEGRCTVVAGVPPDYFSATGQRWGNALYRWDAHERSGYAWWIARLASLFEKFDAVRIDHFIGFQRYWEIDAYAPTAIEGRYRPGPGEPLFQAVRRALGKLPLVAEDLGVLTPEVEALRDNLGLPGMRVLHFSFGTDPGAKKTHPFTFPPRAVVFTGTHDNDTTVGWFDALRKQASEGDEGAQRQLSFIQSYLGTDGSEIHWDLLRLAFASPCRTALVPVQDLLGLGSEHRMNTPGTETGNWAFRLTDQQLESIDVARLRHLTATFGRLPSGQS